jgi:hypothetical protein
MLSAFFGGFCRLPRPSGCLPMLTAVFTFWSLSASWAAGCTGDVEQVHNVGNNFVFQTNSSVTPVPGSAYSIYESCVFNPDPKNDIHVNWFVPGPYNTWVLATKNETWSRRQPNGVSEPIDGCIEYGNLGERTVAQYMGGIADISAEQSPQEKTCITEAKGRSNPNRKAEGSNPLEFFADAFDIFFPSDPARAHDTMLHVEGKIAVDKLGDEKKGYESVVLFWVSRAEGRTEGVTSGIKIVPLFEGKTEELLKYFYKENPKPIYINESKSISFGVFGYSNWLLSTGQYNFVDRDNRVLASMRVPLFVPMP